MSRRTIWLDRLVVLLLGAGLAASGLLLAGWQLQQFAAAPDRLSLTGLDDATAAGWWPWAVGGAGVLLVLVGLRWFAAHAPHRRVHDVRLPGSNTDGRLEVDLSAVAGAAAQSLTGIGIHSCTGRAVKDRGKQVVELVVTLEQRTSLADVSAAIERTLAQLATAQPDVAAWVRVRAGTARPRAGARVS